MNNKFQIDKQTLQQNLISFISNSIHETKNCTLPASQNSLRAAPLSSCAAGKATPSLQSKMSKIKGKV